MVDCDPPVHYYHFSEFDLERFAALVARHCAALAYEQKYNHAQKLSNPPQSAAAVEAAWAIEAAFPMPKE